ncbi:MAG: hypothetical protein ACE5LC_03390 [Candidatus Aminicenantales bacterium]
MEGFGSLRFEGEEGTSRFRFSFLFSFPDEGRIESFDMLGRTLSIILFRGREAYLILPSRKVYWSGESKEVLARFIGFELNQQEVMSLLRGKWEGDSETLGSVKLKTWNFGRDAKGRIVSGEKDTFRFMIEEFFPDSNFARRVHFFHQGGNGLIKIFSVEFNRPLKEKAFSLSLLKNYEPKTWAEIEKMLSGK